MDIINPYKGLFQYTSKDEAYFFGREKETIDLMEMIKNNQLVILYGESGTGKTSLINAKLFPELKRKYYFPIYIRLNFLNNVDPLIQ
ncbi:MAG TPA: ATP-binding protein, partial [Saprospiraceae bacterium]|nr:ATP-binding protein [Saprospiraceae bacterium]